MKKNNSTEWAKYSGLGIQMVASVVICLYIGQWIGAKLGSEDLGALFGTLFGLFASIYNLIKQIKN